MSPAPPALSAPARGGHYAPESLWYIVLQLSHCKVFRCTQSSSFCAFQLLLDLVVASIPFVWILPPLEVDPVQKDGVSVEGKVDVIVVIGLEVQTRVEETCTNLRSEVRVRREDSYRYDRNSCILL